MRSGAKPKGTSATGFTKPTSPPAKSTPPRWQPFAPSSRDVRVVNKLLAAIAEEMDAADLLILACNRRQYIDPEEDNLPPGVIPFRRAFKTALVTPTDMVAALGKMK